MYLTFLVSVPFFVVMHFLILRHTKRRALKFANFEALARVTGMELLNRNIIVLVIRLAAILALILSAAGTVIWYTGNVSEYDFVLAIDSSSSMLANDFYPTRLEAAKKLGIEDVPVIVADDLTPEQIKAFRLADNKVAEIEYNNRQS